jgi:hypothetical protein
MSAPIFLTLAQAKDHLRLTTPDGDPSEADLTLKLVAAEQVILTYLSTSAYWAPIVAAWDAATLPADVQAAMLLELGELYRFRGDEKDTPARDPDLAPAIVGLLRRWRDPAVA